MNRSRSGRPVWCLAATLAVTLGVHAAPEPPGHPEPSDAPPREAAPGPAGAAAGAAMDDLPLQLQVRVQSVQENHHVQFDEQGDKQHENHQLNVQMVLSVEGELPVLGYQDLDVDRVVTSAAEELRPQNHRGNRQNLHNVFGEQPEARQINLYVQMPSPQRPADRLQEVSGRVVLLIGVGPLREAVLGPFGEVGGRNATLEGMPGSVLRVSNQQGRLRVEMSEDIRELIERVRLTDARGVEIPARQWGSGGNNNLQYFDFRLAPEADTHVVLQLFDHVAERVGVFTLRDVPLPLPEPPGGLDPLVIRAHPLGAGVPGAALPRIPVILEH